MGLRAYIDKAISDTQVKVFFIDYGTFAVIDRSETRNKLFNYFRRLLLFKVYCIS